MREFVKNTFLTLVTVFLIYMFFNQLELPFIHNVIQLIIYILAIVITIWMVRKLSKWIASFRLKFPVQLIMSLLLVLFFSHELFAPYFYTDNHLKQAGMEKIEIYQQLSNTELSDEERAELAEEALVEDLAYAHASMGIYPTSGPFEQVEIKDVTRSFYQYKLVVEGKQHDQELTETYTYRFEKDGLEFKISGIFVQ